MRLGTQTVVVVDGISPKQLKVYRFSRPSPSWLDTADSPVRLGTQTVTVVGGISSTQLKAQSHIAVFHPMVIHSINRVSVNKQGRSSMMKYTLASILLKQCLAQTIPIQ